MKTLPLRTLSRVFTLCFSFFFFIQNSFLPDVYRGRFWGDAKNYVSQTGYHGLKGVFLYSSHNSFGYLVFLKFHQLFARFLLPSDFDWVNLVSFSQLFLLWFSIYFLFRAIEKFNVRIPIIFEFMALLSPTLAGEAFVTLTDCLALVVCNLSVALTLRMIHRVSIKNTLALGFVCASAIALRPTLVPIFLIYSSGLFLYLCIRKEKIKTFVFLFLPMLISLSWLVEACYLKNGFVCTNHSEFMSRAVAESIRSGLAGARVGGESIVRTCMVQPVDSFSKENFADKCTITLKPVPDLLQCYLRQPLNTIVHLFKKTIGLYDQSRLQSYAGHLTPLGVKILGRAVSGFSVCGFFLLIIVLLFRFVRKEPYHWPSILLSGTYLGFQVNFHVEPRYGMPFFVLGLLNMGLVASHLKEMKQTHRAFVYLCFVLLYAIFQIQLYLWDLVLPNCAFGIGA